MNAMEKYKDYLRCGEIYKAPSQSDRNPYILKCFNCENVFLLLESFIFHFEDYCQEKVPTEIAYAEQQAFKIEIVKDEDYGMEYQDLKYNNDGIDVVKEEDNVMFIVDEVIANEDSAIKIDDDPEVPMIEIKDEPVAENEDVCVEEVDVYVSDILDPEKDDTEQNANVTNHANEEAPKFGYHDLSEDTESADEDTGCDSSCLSIHNFMESYSKVQTFIFAYKKRPKLWNRKLYPHLDKDYARGVKNMTEELNDQYNFGIDCNLTSGVISHLLKNFRKDLKGVNKCIEGQRYTPQWYFRHMRFLKPHMESKIYLNLDRRLPRMLPEDISKIITIYRTYPHLWNTCLAEYCCDNKRSESEVLMLQTIELRMNIKLTQKLLQILLRCIHGYFSQEKSKRLENSTIVASKRLSDDLPSYYTYLEFLYDHVEPFKCSECSLHFQNPFVLKTHIATHTGSSLLICSVCKKNFKVVGNYISHVRQHMKDDNYLCGICNKTCESVDELMAHKATTCPKINKKPPTYPNLNINKKHQNMNFSCTYPLCDKMFVMKESLENHMEVQHKKNGFYCCRACGKRFVSSSSLIAHKIIHKDSSKYKCPKCCRSYKMRFSLLSHMKKHEGGNTRVYKFI